jgi:15-hydroxyprostaglandin dehydrogenase (NAD)
MKFNEAVAIITGGATGFGRAFAERVLSGGGRAFITDVNVEQLEITGKELAAKFGKGKIAWTHQNVVDTDSFHRVFDHAAKYFERPVNMLVNNAGIAGDMSFFNEDAPRQWEHVITIDLTALMRGTQVAVQQMKKHLGGKEGVIINLASVAGLYPTVLTPEYSAAKHGVIGFTRSCHPLQKQANIRVVGLAPGFAKTAMGNLAEEHMPDQTAAMGGLIEVQSVVDAFQLAVEDETNPGRIIRIVKTGHTYYRFAGDKALYPNAKL